ncbi:hypothetical protein [Pseudomonas panipatensis]|jgi:macrodomain Ter protein organizer (MatP/YcbG family)|uniref:Organiser of macrodomain of Terminus of chromosome n=1 Tax=Pseudomonas panipatensis TaxID=428992 RepID=A0A1G8HM05_9PSED|nr:hypothetical protein [Pseudomonas panipatensis]SDI07531.1 Organiser of macrodomain of Terminus of chromosome [Pseudomonas panipatensis]SMP58978.1 Organiser of macrodomain of Terminus of chromosome [Pseudomonas panipatensis]
MGKKKDVSEWLTDENCEWAMQYIRDKAKNDVKKIISLYTENPLAVELFPKPANLKSVKLKSSSSNLKTITNIIRELENSLQGREIISGIKSALRQRKYRSPKNGKTPKTFTLPNSTFRKLQNLAKENGKTHTEIITALLDKTEIINENLHKQVKDLKHALRNEREIRESNAAAHQSKIDAAMRQLEISLQRLAAWETAYGDELPTNPDIATIKQLVEKKIKQAKLVIRYAGQEGLFNEEPSLQESQQNHVQGRPEW